MLQQTGVSTVVPYFQRFCARFPDLAALAGAEEEEVLASWSGLGYYARARNLHRTARLVVERHGGRLARAARQALRQLPGLGPYTAAAVAAIAFGARTVAVDGNAARVLARLFGVAEPIDRPAVREQLRDRGEALRPEQRCGDFVQAIMELGAMVCVPVAARLLDAARCSGWCEAHRQGRQDRAAAAIGPRRQAQGGAGLRGGGAARAPAAGAAPAGDPAGRHLDPALGGARLDEEDAPRRRRPRAGPLGLAAEGEGERLGSIRHVFTHRDVTAEVVRQRVRGQARRAGPLGRRPRDGQAPALELHPEDPGAALTLAGTELEVSSAAPANERERTRSCRRTG